MSRIAKKTIPLPSNVKFSIENNVFKATGAKGTLELKIHPFCSVVHENNELSVTIDTSKTKGSYALAGTMRALLNNLIIGVSQGFEKKLSLVGVGYRAKAQGDSVLDLQLGFSHPISHKMPDSIKCETPSQTEIIIRGLDKQLVGEVAAKIRAYRPLEPYKGKGVKYFNEVVELKEVKKK